MTRSGWVLAASLLLLAQGCTGSKEPAQTRGDNPDTKANPDGKSIRPLKPERNPMEIKVDQFAPTDIGVDETKITPQQRPVIKKLIEAARLIDQLFLRQVARENPTWRKTLAADPRLADTLAYFDIMYGPWDRLAHDKPFWGTKAKPKGSTFYPEDLTAAQFQDWIANHPDDKAALTSYYTVIERDGAGLKAVPYSEAYREFLEPAAKRLEEAAALTPNKRLKTYLTARAEAFRTNLYRQSDMDWMELGDGDIELVIGPYEVYEDGLMGYKAAFEAFITLRDPEDTKELDSIKALIPKMERYLPIPDEHKNLNRGTDSPIAVVDVLYTAGDTRAGVQTLAFNLPNDEVVREKKGSKKVLLKNIGQAKFNQVLRPIAARLLKKDQLKRVTFKAFFNNILLHETAHGLGPGSITVERNGKPVKTGVNEELKELYSFIEEAKADVLGMYLNFFLIKKGLYPESFREELFASFLAGIFRSIRFGANEAHGKANAMQLNYLLEAGAFKRTRDGRYAYIAAKMQPAIEKLSTEILMIEARGDYQAAKQFIAKYETVPPRLVEQLAALSNIPTDIRPNYLIEKQMAGWN